MAKTKITRKDLLKKPDEFITISTKVVTFVTGHTRQFKIAGMVLIGIIIIGIGIGIYVKYIDKKAQATYNMAYYAISKNLDPEKDKEEFEESKKLFTEVIESYGISKVASLALPEIAFIDFLQKNYDDAIAGYSKFLDQSTDESYKSLARIALAVCYEEKGDYEKAISILEILISGPDDFFKEQAMLNQARIYRLSNKQEKSNEILREFVDKFKTSPFLPLAKAYIKP